MCVPRDGRICTHLLLGGAGEILCDEAGENNLGDEALMVRRMRWHMLRRL